MEITDVTKVVLEEGEAASLCRVSFRANGHFLFQDMRLSNNLPPHILEQHLVLVAMRRFQKDGRKYKFRAETNFDVISLLQMLPRGNVLQLQAFPDPVLGEGYPDRVCELELLNMTLSDLKKVIAKIPDGHVMLETVAEIEKYTGER